MMNRVIRRLISPRQTMQSCLSVIEDCYFDYRFRLETREELQVQDLDISPIDKQHAEKYKPTRSRYFQQLMKRLKPDRDQVFVDVGCGKGRILLLAALYGFKKIRGIEISSCLSEIAIRNIKAFQTKRPEAKDIEVHCESILDYQFRHDETFLFLYSPFDAFVTERFLEQVQESLHNNPRDLTLVFNEFRFPALIAKTPFPLHSTLRYGAADFRIYRHTQQRTSFTGS
ncbi:class I SAM-dependent methyltransferase [Pirellulaceae bacterium SH449]